MRTDDNNNPTAFITDLARQAKLVENIDYIDGTIFPNGIFTTAKILGDPLLVTIKLIDNVGFYNAVGNSRWLYISMPMFIWKSLNFEQKRDVIGFMYQHEGGTKMINLFPNYGQK